MKRVKSFSLLAVFFLIFGVAANVSAMAISISDPIITDISASSFSVVWKVNQAASGNVEVYSDAAATTPVALTIEYKSSAHENAEANGVMKVVVKGASAATPYYVKTVTTSKDTGEVYTSGVTEATTAMIGDLALERPSIYQIVYKDAAQTQDARGSLLIGRMDSAISPITAWVDFDEGFGVSYGLLQTALFLGSDGKTLETAGKAMTIEAFGGILGEANTDIAAVTTDPNTSQDGGAVSLVATSWTITPTTASGTGTVIPAEAVTVFDGASYTITMTPATAGDTVTATDNGATATLTQVGNDYTYTLTVINADHAIEVTFGGGGVVVTPMDIPTAVLAIDGGDTIVDADATAYENEHITGAITAADVPAATDTRILVYCRDVANAQAQAQALVNAGYTNVAYLEVPFADFAADTANVTNEMVQYKLTVVKEGTGAATATVTPTEGFYKRDEQVTITANPAADSWSTNAPGGVVIMSGPQTVTATFTPSGCDLTAVVLTPADPTTGDAPLTVNLTATVTGTADGYELTVKDASGNDIAGYPQTTATNTFIVADLAIGSYTAVVTASNSTIDGCSVASVALPITVTAPSACAASFTINPNLATVGESVTFDASASTSATGAITMYAWDFKDPSGASAGNPGGVTTSKPFNQIGTYTVTLTINDDQGCTNTSTQTFDVQDAPTCSVTIDGPTTTDLNIPVTFTANVTAPGATVTNYNWTMGDGTVIDGADKSSVTHTYTSGTSASLYLSVTTDQGAACNPSDSWSITLTGGGETPDGDGNGDGFVDIYDALAAAMYDVALLTEAEIARFAHLDVDQNGVVDTNDALAIAKYDVGLPCGCTLDQ